MLQFNGLFIRQMILIRLNVSGQAIPDQAEPGIRVILVL